MRNGCADFVISTSLRHVPWGCMKKAKRDRAHGPGHPDRISEDGYEVRGNVGHGWVGIGVEDFIRNLDRARDALVGMIRYG